MDIYKKKKLKNFGLFLIFVLGIVLQFEGKKIESVTGLVIQLISLAILLLVLYLYNRRFS